MKLFYSTLAALMLLAFPASALTFDLTGAPFQPPERAVANDTKITDQGVDLYFFATGGLAYFDGPSGGRPAGLGVCDARNNPVNGQECARAGDDNIQSGEEAFVQFAVAGQAKSGGAIDDVLLRDAGHYLLDNASFEYSLNGGLNWLVGVTNAVGVFNFGANNQFTSAGLGFRVGGNAAEQFYVSTLGSDTVGVTVNPIPLPAGAWLMLAGLGALGVARRRQTR